MRRRCSWGTNSALPMMRLPDKHADWLVGKSLEMSGAALLFAASYMLNKKTRKMREYDDRTRKRSEVGMYLGGGRLQTIWVWSRGECLRLLHICS